jgi:hypothetical protein
VTNPNDPHNPIMAYKDNEPIPPAMFEDERFAELNAELFDRYIDMRINGHHPQVILGKVFGPENDGNGSHLRVTHLERNPYYIRNFEARMRNFKVNEVWNANISLHETLKMYRDPMNKCGTRLSALRELNIMVGIVIVDENGKTKAGRSLADFYADAESLKNPPKAPKESKEDGEKA